jgi:hypothetical protein
MLSLQGGGGDSQTQPVAGRPIEYFVGIHRGDRSRFEIERFRSSEPRVSDAARTAHVAS